MPKTTRPIEWPVWICDACGKECYPATTIGPVVMCWTCLPH